MSSYSVITSDFVNLSITNSGQESCCVERRFQKSITIDEFKVRFPFSSPSETFHLDTELFLCTDTKTNAKLQGKLELLTGGNPSTMAVEVYDKNDKLICKLEEGQRLLGSYPIDDGMRIHVSL